MIGLLKRPPSICQSDWKEIRKALPVIRWVRWGHRTRISSLFRGRYTKATTPCEHTGCAESSLCRQWSVHILPWRTGVCIPRFAGEGRQARSEQGVRDPREFPRCACFALHASFVLRSPVKHELSVYSACYSFSVIWTNRLKEWFLAGARPFWLLRQLR